MVAKMIDARNETGSDADMFFLSTGGWDTHSQVLMNQDNLFANVDLSFKAFADELKAKNVWDSVTLIETSDFARTLTQNGGLGSDHAWVSGRKKSTHEKHDDLTFSLLPFVYFICETPLLTISTGWQLHHDGRKCQGRTDRRQIPRCHQGGFPSEHWKGSYHTHNKLGSRLPSTGRMGGC